MSSVINIRLEGIIMKKACLVIIMAATIAISSSASAQMEYLEVLRSDVRAERVAIITEQMMFTEEQAEIFWPIYRDMEYEVNKLTDRRIALIKDYSDSYAEMTDKKAKELIEESFKIQEKYLGIEKKYFRKMSNALDPITAAKFMQVNHEMKLMVDLQISSGLPFFK
jgi:hypothetical protein